MSLPTPTVTITGDYMKAYMTVPALEGDGKYTVQYLTEILGLNKVTMGIKEETLKEIANNHLYEKEILVAEGAEVKDGEDGWFEYLFETQLTKKPVIQEDGTVDYKNIKMIELVEAGNEIAVYHPATRGEDGFDLGGQSKKAKNGKELAPLKGSGFEVLEDGVTYRATMGGKITVKNNRLTISPVHEVSADVDLTSGNVDFNGDVIIHGSVAEGMSVKATGTVTVDQVVESAYIEGKKGIILRGGVLGKNGAKIRSKGPISALFFEYADVETESDIEADSFLDCRVYSGGSIHLTGKKGRIVGGTVHAVCSIEAQEIGNMVGANTEVSVGVHHHVIEKMGTIEHSLQEEEKQLRRIEDGLNQFESMMREKGLPFREDPRRMALVKEKVRLTALIAGQKEEFSGLQKVVDAAEGAYIQIAKSVYPGVSICVDEQSVQVKDLQKAVEYKKYKGKIGMFNKGVRTN